MTTSDGREVPEDERRKQILLKRSVRDYVSDRSDESGLTYSEQLAEWLPDDPEAYRFEFVDRDIVNLKATPEVHARVTGMAGKRVSPGEVVALFALLEALRNGDLDAAGRIASTIPEVLWDYLESARAEVEA